MNPVLEHPGNYNSYTFVQKSIFSLGDEDEVLTHKGMPLLNVDRYEDPREQSDSEDELLSGKWDFALCNLSHCYERSNYRN